jgi:hypothetical protein
VHVPTSARMDADRIAALVEHRSMRIDGPTFRGRPLGHRVDPLRSVLAPPTPDVWREMVTRVLEAHDFRELSRSEVDELTLIHGTLAQTLMWQSPAFAEYGYSYRSDEVRVEPAPEMLFGELLVILDSAESRQELTSKEASALSPLFAKAADESLPVVVFFRGRDLSGTGGLWRSTVNDSAVAGRLGGWRQIGLEALTNLVLTTTLVYLEFAAELDWEHANYLS